jgi:hypothetical protein
MAETTAMTASLSTTILSIDLGKFKSVACAFDPPSGEHRFETVVTSPSTMHDLLAEVTPAVLVIEACSIAGWVFDLASSLGIAVKVANANGEAWTWKKVKRKTDRDDALKLAKLQLMNQLPTVHMSGNMSLRLCQSERDKPLFAKLNKAGHCLRESEKSSVTLVLLS